MACCRSRVVSNFRSKSMYRTQAAQAVTALQRKHWQSVRILRLARSKKSRTGDVDNAMLNRPLRSPDTPIHSQQSSVISVGARDPRTIKSQFKGHRGPQGIPVEFPHVSTP